MNENINSFSENDLLLMILYLYIQDEKERDKKWEEFEHQLIYENRFSSTHEVVKELHTCAEMATITMNPKTPLYRARSFHMSGWDKLLKYYLKVYNYTERDIKRILEQSSESELMLVPLLYKTVDYSPENLSKYPITNEMKRAIEGWKKVKFKGYNKKDSTAPEADKIKSGRANPDHIRYLYLSEDKVTPIYEIRPTIGERINIAKFKLKRSIKLYDLTLEWSKRWNDKKQEVLPRLYDSIGNRFSKPHNGDVSTYIPTQFLAEEIKQMGFDGLRFKSSLHAGGVNVVLFNPDDCEAVSSDVVTVDRINIETSCPWDTFDN